MTLMKKRLQLLRISLGVLLFLVALYFATFSLVPKADVNTPQPPKLLDTTFPIRTGIIRHVNAGDDLQAAINTAQPGDTLILSNNATFTGNFTLPAKNNPNNAWIIIQSEGPGLPGQGTRINPYTDTSAMAKIVSPNDKPAISALPQASYYRLVGINITLADSVTTNNGILVLGDPSKEAPDYNTLPAHIVLDRLYVHAPFRTNVATCVDIEATFVGLVDSYVADCQSSTQDSHALVVKEGPDPFKINNNFLESTGDTVVLGPNTTPFVSAAIGDIELTQNYLVSYPNYLTTDDQFASHHRTVVIQNVSRMRMDGNVILNLANTNPIGIPLQIDTISDSELNPNVVEDLSVTNNTFYSYGAGIDMYGVDHTGATNPKTIQRVKIANNLFEMLNSSSSTAGGYFLSLLGGDSITITHNTISQDSQNGVMISVGPATTTNFVFTNNISASSKFEIDGKGGDPGNQTIGLYLPQSVFAGNVIVGASSALYPGDNYYPQSINDVGFENYDGAQYNLSSTSTYSGKATDGKDPGVDFFLVRNNFAAAVLGIPLSEVPPIPSPEPIPSQSPVPSPSVSPSLNPAEKELYLIVNSQSAPSSSDQISLQIQSADKTPLLTFTQFTFNSVLNYSTPELQNAFAAHPDARLVVKADGYFGQSVPLAAVMQSRGGLVTPVVLVPGDLNNDGALDLKDLTRLIAWHVANTKNNIYSNGVSLSDINRAISRHVSNFKGEIIR